MRIVHLSDLHIGKRVNDFSMLEDQKYILDQILGIIDSEKPQAVMIAGDVYDRTVPSAEAVQLFDEFLVSLAQRSLEVLVISGNHDSAERIAFGGRLMGKSGIHLSPVFGRDSLRPITLYDEFGAVNFYLLPFIKPINVRAAFECEAESYTDAVRTALENMQADFSARNVLVTHQFVTGAALCDSEEVSVGGSDNVDASVFEGFDYVALGHIHGPQHVGCEHIRYCGTPLKYSFSEARHKKSVTCVELCQKGALTIRTIPLVPLHDMREISGYFADIMQQATYSGAVSEDYMRIILKDEDDIPNAIERLRHVYPNTMRIDYDNSRTRATAVTTPAESRKSEIEVFAEFYRMRNNRELTDQQLELARRIMEEVKEGER